MPQQLIYTSAPRGLVAGRAGFCTVAMSAGMREALALRLEQISYFDHAVMTSRVIHACRVIDVRGTRFHVLSRIQDAGLDFTQRTNFLAHHLVFTPDELRNLPSAPDIFRQWNGWLKLWRGEPHVIENENWDSLEFIPRRQPPARAWAKLTGDAANALALFDLKADAAIDGSAVSDETLLDLFADALALVEVKERRTDWVTAAWQHTFTTALQPQDTASDFRWRAVMNAEVFPTLRRIPLVEARPARLTVEEASFARSGYQPPKIVEQPRSVDAREGEPVRLRVSASGVPTPNIFEWFSVSRGGEEQKITGANSSELLLQSPPVGVSRYCARVSNSRGDTARSAVAVVSVHVKGRTASRAKSLSRATVAGRGCDDSSGWVADPDDLRSFLESVESKKRKAFWTYVAVAVLLLGICAGAFFFGPPWFRKRDVRAGDGKSTNAVRSAEAMKTSLPQSNAVAAQPASVSIETEPRLLVLGTVSVGVPLPPAINSFVESNKSLLRVCLVTNPDLHLLTTGAAHTLTNSAEVEFPNVGRLKRYDVWQITPSVKTPILARFATSNAGFQLIVWPTNSGSMRQPVIAHEHHVLFTNGWPLLFAKCETPVLFSASRPYERKPFFSESLTSNISGNLSNAFADTLTEQLERLERLQRLTPALAKWMKFSSAVRRQSELKRRPDNMWDEIQMLCSMALYDGHVLPDAPFVFFSRDREPDRPAAVSSALKELNKIVPSDVVKIAIETLSDTNILLADKNLFKSTPQDLAAAVKNAAAEADMLRAATHFDSKNVKLRLSFQNQQLVECILQ